MTQCSFMCHIFFSGLCGVVVVPKRGLTFCSVLHQTGSSPDGNLRNEVSSSRNSDRRKTRGRSASEALESLCEWLQRKSLSHRVDEVRTRCPRSGTGQNH